MNNKLLGETAEKLIEQAKEMSIEKILNFAEELYGINRKSWEQLCKIPIAATYEDEVIFPFEISSTNRDEILDSIDECVEEKIGKSEAAVIPFDNIYAGLSDEIVQRCQKGIEDGSIKLDYYNVIVYNEAKLKRIFMELFEAGTKTNPPRTMEEIKEDYLNMVSETFIHERMHIITDNPLLPEDNLEYNKDDEDNNEVLIDTMAKIIQVYSKGDTIEECLHRVIKTRGRTTSYDGIDDREVLSMFMLYPNEISSWLMQDAHDKQKNNIYQEKHEAVIGERVSYRKERMLNKVGEYFNKTISPNLECDEYERRKEMLEMLGVKNIMLQQSMAIDSEQIKEVAFSSQAMEELLPSKQAIVIASQEKENPMKTDIE